MSKTSDKFQAIADSIRAVNGTENTYTPDQMPNAINELNTGYTLSKDGTTLKLTDSKGNVQTVDIGNDTDTTYTLSLSGNKLILKPSTGDQQEIDLSSLQTRNTTYWLEVDGNILYLDGSDGTRDSVRIATELQRQVKSNSDRLGGLSFSLSESGLLHIEEVMS